MESFDNRLSSIDEEIDSLEKKIELSKENRKKIIILQMFIKYFLKDYLGKRIEILLRNRFNLNNYEENDLESENIAEWLEVKISNPFEAIAYPGSGSIYVPQEYYEEFLMLLTDFFARYGLAFQKSDEKNKFLFNTNLKKLIAAYQEEFRRLNQDYKISETEVDYFEKYEFINDCLDSVYSEDVVSNLFYDLFLKGFIKDLIDAKTILQDNVEGKGIADNLTNIVAIYCCKSSKNKGSEIFIEGIYYYPFIRLVKTFVEENDLGMCIGPLTHHRYDSESCICFNTTLAKLKTAYCNEFQRAEYLLGDAKQLLKK